MKTIYSTLMAIFALAIMIGTSSCNRCTDVRSFIDFDPVYITEAEFEAPIAVESAREFGNTGMIAAYKNMLFINELNLGIHVVDNSDPLNPQNLKFINILNNTNFSIADDVLYANRVGEIVGLDISDLNNIREIDRTTDVFENSVERTDDGRYIAYYQRTERVREVDCSDLDQNWWRFQGEGFAFDNSVNAPSIVTSSQFDAATSSFGANSTVSFNSSSAKFATTKGNLYALNSDKVNIFSLNGGNLQWSGSYDFESWENMETLFPLNDYLFVGGQSNMQILSLNNPEHPEFLSSFTHTTSCDPVVANSTNAYVTIRDGAGCGNGLNRLHVLNIQNIQNPVQTDSEVMINPRGLTILGKHLFVCDGPSGVIAFDVADESNIRRLGTLSSKQANDALVVAQNLIVVSGDDGIFLVDVSDPNNMVEVSTIYSK